MKELSQKFNFFEPGLFGTETKLFWATDRKMEQGESPLWGDPLVKTERGSIRRVEV